MLADSAVQAADLVETLKGDGPFTVFGPNNDAFAKLPAGTLDTLTRPENKQQLTDILTYHVVPGTYTSADLRVMAQKGEMLTIWATREKKFCFFKEVVRH